VQLLVLPPRQEPRHGLWTCTEETESDESAKYLECYRRINQGDRLMSQADTTARDTTTLRKSGKAETPRTTQARVLRPVLMLFGVILLVVVSSWYWLTAGRYVSSDDSYVDAAKVSLSTDVSGLVDEVDVRDNQHVEAGQILFKVGQAQYANNVAGAQARLNQVELDIAADKFDYAGSLADVKMQDVQIQKDQADLTRYAAVVSNGGVTKSTYDDARFQLESDQVKLMALQDQAAIQLAKLDDNPNINVEDTPEYKSALAMLHQAQTDQSHSVVKAPYSGEATLVEQLQPGMFLPAGTAAFGLVSDTDIWITAQPKESDLTWVRDGQSVIITIDTYPGQTWHGVVESISPASGSEFSVLPAQNSSGNWVKVVQRIPVRVKVTFGPTEFELRDGMSAEVSIDTDHHRHLSDLF
jgi:membrane fusion protein, multidrug efflux system